MSFAPLLQLLAVALALLALAIVVKGWIGEPESPPNVRFWGRVALAAFFSVTTVHVWYPDGAHRAAQNRANVAVESTRDAVRRYVKRHRTLPSDLAALVPDSIAAIPNPRVAGSSLVYRRIPGSDHLFDLTVPCPGNSKPLAHYEEQENLLKRILGR
jgi:hypothetical protein